MVPALIVQPFIENAIWHGVAPKDGGLITVSMTGDEEIITCEVDDDGIGRETPKLNKPMIHESRGVNLSRQKCVVVSKTLEDIEELLPPDLFQRIHHSTVLNLDFVTHFVRADGGYVKLQTGENLIVSKSKKDAVMERLGLKKD